MPTTPTSFTIIRAGNFPDPGGGGSAGAGIRFSWATDDGTDTYSLYSCNAGNTVRSLILPGLTGTSATITSTGAVNATNYYVMTSTNIDGESGFTSVVNNTAPPYALDTSKVWDVVSLAASAIGANTATLTWSDAQPSGSLETTGGASAYSEIEITRVSTSGVVGGDSPFTINSAYLANGYVLTDLRSLSVYTVRVRNVGYGAAVGTPRYKGRWSNTVTINTTSGGLPPLSGLDVVHCTVGVYSLTPYVYTGPSTIPFSTYWSISGQPIGLTLQPDNADPSNKTIVIAGAPESAGLYTAQLALILSDNVTLLRLSIDFYVSSSTWFDWFHTDPSRTDLQFDLRNRIVFSRSGNNPSGGGDNEAGALDLFYQETETINIILKDGPRLADYPDLDEVILYVRLPGMTDMEPLVTARSASLAPATQEVIDSHVTYPLDVLCWSDILHRIIDAADRSTTPNAAGDVIVATGGLHIRVGTKWTYSKSFVVNIHQSYAY